MLFPPREALHHVGERAEVATTPELLVGDKLAAFDFAVLLRAPWRYVPVANALGFDGESEGERELRAVVVLDFPDWKRHRPLHLGEKAQARVLMVLAIQA